MKDKPLVSIILPVFKSEDFLEECIQSLLSQNYTNFEVVAVVDYLGDNCLKILRKYRKLDKRIRVYSNLQRYGLAVTLNRSVRLSRGQYVAFMDSSGIAAKSRISKQVTYLIKNPKVAAVGTQAHEMDEKNKSLRKSRFPLFHEEIYKHLISALSMKFETVMVDKTRLPKDILKFKKNTRYPFIYVDVLMRIGQYKELGNIDKSLVSIRDISKQDKQVLNLQKRLSFIKLLFESTTNYEYKPSIRSLFSPILR